MENKLPAEIDAWYIDESKLPLSMNPEEARREATREFRREESRNFSRSLRYSFVVLLFLTTENQLNRVCDALRVERGFPIGARDLRGASAIDRCKNYLTKVEGVQLGDMKPWRRMKDLQEIRNCIVHEGGRVNDLDAPKVAKLKKFIETEKGVSIGGSGADSDEIGMLLIKPEFCQNFAEDAKTLFNDLFVATKLL
ncbi:MAG: hypothetical protein ABSA97_04005 [Verrucomicrobiia bacterium]